MTTTTTILSVTTFAGDLDGAVVFTAQATEAISKGEAVYIDGIAGNTPTVSLAQANSASTMPAFGIADTDIAVGASGHIVSFGQIGNLDTQTPNFNIGDTLFVSAATAGALTNSAPTGSGSLIQNVGRVERRSTTVGRIVVAGAGRTNATPNLNENDIFIGNASNQSSTTPFLTALRSLGGIVSNASGDAIVIDANDNVTMKEFVTFEEDLFLTGAQKLTMTTNTAAAFDILDGSNSYLKFDTTSGSELVTIGKSLALAGDDLTITGALDLAIPDNTASALRVVEGANPYIAFDTTNGSELITISKNMEWESSQIRTLSALDVRVLDESGLALRVEDGNGNEYLRFNTTNAVEAIVCAKTLETNGDLQIDGGATLANGTSINVADNSGFAFRIMEGTNEYMRVTTTDAGEKIVFKKELELDGALNIDGTVDCSGQVTFSGAQTITIPDNLGFGLRVSSADNAEFVRFTTTDGAELVDFSKAVKLDGGLTLNSNISAQAGAVDITMIDSSSNAIDFVIDGGNRMMRFNTNTETVLMEQNFEVDGTSQFDGAMDINSTMDISGGEVTFSANVDIQLVDNSGQALDIAEGANNYLRFITLDGAEEIEVYQDLELKAENISLTGTAGVDLTIIDGFGSALTIKDSGGDLYQSFKTTGPQQVQLFQDVIVTTGNSLTFDSVEIANIQTSSETFADNNTSIMTSAAIKDLVDTVSGVTQTEGTFTATFRGSTAEPGTLVTTTGYLRPSWQDGHGHNRHRSSQLDWLRRCCHGHGHASHG